jgi:hypothetical protein
MMSTFHRPAWLARRDDRAAARLPRYQKEGESFRFFTGVLLAVPVGLLLWWAILYISRAVPVFG